MLPSLALHLPTAALAPGSREARGTTANETIRHITGCRASPSIQTRLLGTDIHECFTVTTGEGWAAHALVVVGELDAVHAALGAAGARQALVDVPLATLPSKARQAATAVAPDPVHALTPVQAVGASGTVVNVLFTEQTSSARWAGALEVVH